MNSKVEYNLEVGHAIAEIKKNEAKLVLLQLPSGLKPRALEIRKEIEKSTKAKVLVWLSGCYGACDMPLGLEKMGVDMIIQWGHNRYVK